MSKHTPGPWNRGIAQFVFQGEQWDPHNSQRLIATCEPSTRTQKDWEETWANARLIAAVPDLLKALQNLVDGLDKTNWSSWQTTAHFSEQHEAARAAIAKATGEQT